MNSTKLKTSRNLFFKKCLMVAAGIFLWMSVSVCYAQEGNEYRVAVMPFIKGKNPENIQETLSCPYQSLCFEDKNVRTGADQTLTRMAQDILYENLGADLMPQDKVEYIYETMKINYAEDTPQTFALRLGKLLHVDYIFVGNVWRYRERTGNAFASADPASVGFAVYLIGIENEKLIWSATYDETQQSLTENLFNAPDFFKQGAKWLTVDEFARYGMKKILKKIPLFSDITQEKAD